MGKEGILSSSAPDTSIGVRGTGAGPSLMTLGPLLEVLVMIGLVNVALRPRGGISECEAA